MVKKEKTQLAAKKELEQLGKDLVTQIEKGKKIRDTAINLREELRTARAKEENWSRYNIELLKSMFANEDIISEYNLGYGLVWGIGSPVEDIQQFKYYMNDYINLSCYLDF